MNLTGFRPIGHPMLTLPCILIDRYRPGLAVLASSALFLTGALALIAAVG